MDSSNMDEDIELVEKKPFIAEAGKSHVPPRNTRSSAVESKIKFISYTAIGLLGCFLLYYQYALSGVPPQETAKESDNSDNNAAINPISSGTKDGYDSSRKKIGVSLPPMLDYINVTASKMFPDKLPDCLYLLRQQPIDPQDKDQRITYFIEQSMNMYWKHDKSFRKHHLHYDMPLLDDATDALNQQAPVAATVLEPDKQKTNDTKHAILHQRIYEAGGSLPFLINWRPSLPTTKTTSNSCPSSHPHGFPIFQRALSADCSDYQNDNIAFQYWTIPTAPILKSKYENDSEIPAIDSNQMGNRDSLLQAVVVATTSTPTTYGDDDHDADTEESIALRREIQKLRQKSKTELADKLVFLSDEETESESGLKSDEEEIFDERYFAYSAVLDMDITSFLYPKVLCETSSSSSPVLMKQVPSTTSSALSFMDTLWASTLEPWVHYVPLKQDWSDLKEQIEYVLDPQNAQQMNAIVQKGKQWCQTYMTKQSLTERFLQSLVTFVERLDEEDPSWTTLWRDHGKEYLVGHWMRQPGGDSWTLPRAIVGEIKSNGLRADEPRAKEIWNNSNR